MTWIVEWNGREYDIDPLEFNQLEMGLLRQRTGLTFPKLIQAIADVDGDAIRGLFWLVEHRDNPDVKYGDYAGPPVKVVLPQLAGFLDAVGKAMPEVNEPDGSPPSPSGSDTPPSSSID